MENLKPTSYDRNFSRYAQFTRDVDVLVPDGHGVHAQLFRDEVDGVQAILYFVDHRVFGHTPGRGDGRAQIK